MTQTAKMWQKMNLHVECLEWKRLAIATICSIILEDVKKFAIWLPSLEGLSSMLVVVTCRRARACPYEAASTSWSLIE